jgi:hypothetical protein
MYGQQYGEQIQYLIKLQARIFYKMTHGSKRKITERRRNLSVGAASTGTTGGEAGRASFFFILLVLLIGLQHLVWPKATIETSLSRLMVATQQVWENVTWGLITRKARLRFDVQKAIVMTYALSILGNELISLKKWPRSHHRISPWPTHSLISPLRHNPTKTWPKPHPRFH